MLNNLDSSTPCVINQSRKANSSTFTKAQTQFAAHMRNPNEPPPKDVEDRRLKIYRNLIYKNVEGFISGAFPVLRSLYKDDAWHQMVRDFLVSYRCQTPYFLQISQEFLNYLQEKRAANEGDPPFLLELAHYEWVELATDMAEDEEIPELSVEPDWLNGVIVLNPYLYSLSYRFPVHLIRPDYQPHEPATNPVCLLVYRNNDDLRVKFSETNAITMALITALQEKENLTGRSALSDLAESLGVPIDGRERFAMHGLDLFRHLAELGVVLGTVKFV